MRHKWIFVVLWLPLLAAGANSRYIVELSGDPVATHVAKESKRTGKKVAIDSEVARTRRKDLDQEQKQARTALKDLGVEVLDSTQTTSNTLIVSMPDSLVDKVAALPGVKRVHKARPVKMNLDHALPLHHVPQAWAATGGMGAAGMGVKIGMIDTGIDIKQPGMQDSTLQVPDGFPKVNTDSDTAFTNSKVIVARNYAKLFDPSDITAQDGNGHGTGTAMAAAGAPNTGPFGTIVGVAPKAWLGAYKALGASGGGSSAAILKAIDDAVADGMDVINLSLNQQIPQPIASDPVIAALETAAAAGVIITSSAGNGASALSNGFDPSTVDSAGAAPSAITVGAIYNDRFLAPGSVSVGDGPLIGALTGDEDTADTPAVTGPLFDVATLDQAGDACLPFPTGSMTGKIAFIIRSEATGGCTFETKLNDVARAGAIAALMYNVADRDPPQGGFAAGAATLPALFLLNGDGVAIKKQLAANPSLTATLTFQVAAIPFTQNGVTDFSSEGPNLDLSIKPDLVAVGTDIYTATELTVSNNDLYDPSGYQVELDGTSYSAPLVAGAAAVVKSVRPGLTAAQYRSLIINTADAVIKDDQTIAGVQQAGAGKLNLQTAVTATFAVGPTNLSFLTGGPNPNLSKTLTISNVGAAAESYSLAVVPRNPRASAPALGSSTLTIQPGQSATVPVTFTASGLAPGPYEGFVTIAGSISGVQERVPYWYAVPSSVPATITPMLVTTWDDNNTARRGSRLNDAILFRVQDVSGLILPGVQPTVTAISGGGSVISMVSVDPDIAGCDPTDPNELCFTGGFDVSVRLGAVAGPNIFEITVGNVAPFDIEIDGN